MHSLSELEICTVYAVYLGSRGSINCPRAAANVSISFGSCEMFTWHRGFFGKPLLWYIFEPFQNAEVLQLGFKSDRSLQHHLEVSRNERKSSPAVSITCCDGLLGALDIASIMPEYFEAACKFLGPYHAEDDAASKLDREILFSKILNGFIGAFPSLCEALMKYGSRRFSNDCAMNYFPSLVE